MSDVSWLLGLSRIIDFNCDSGTSMHAVRIGQLYVMPWELALMLAVIFKQPHFVTFVLVTLIKLWASGQER